MTVELTEQQWDLLTRWTPGDDLAEDLRDADTGEDSTAAFELCEQFIADGDPKRGNLFAFCYHWSTRLADLGECADRDSELERYRPGGDLEADWPTALAEPDKFRGDAHFSDDAGTGLYKLAVKDLDEDYKAFGEAVAAWRDELREQGWVLPGDELGDETGDAQADVELPEARVRVTMLTDSGSYLAEYPSVPEFVADFDATGLGSVWDVRPILADVVASGGGRPHPLSGKVTGGFGYDKPSHMVKVEFGLMGEVVQAGNTAAIQQLTSGDQVAYYVQFGSCVVVSSSWQFDAIDRVFLTMVRIASNQGQNFAVPSEPDEIGTITRIHRRGPNRDYFVVRPAALAASDEHYEHVRALIKSVHPHRHVERSK